MRERASIIVLCHNRWEDTHRCLAALRRHTTPGSYEALVYDNASSDGTGERLRALRRSWPELSARSNPRNLPFAAAINRGMRRAAGRRLVWLNNDAIVGPGWLEGLSAALTGAPGAAAAGPMTDHMAPPQQLCRPFATRRSGRATDVPFLGGFCLMLDRAAARAVGPLDEGFVWGWEDMDYCLRLRDAGYRLVLARDVFVRHAGSRTLDEVPPAERARQDLANRARVRRKWSARVPWGADLRALLEAFPHSWVDGRPRASIAVLCASRRRSRGLLKTLRAAVGTASYEVLAAPLDAEAGLERELRALARDWRELRVLGPWNGIPRAHAANLAFGEARGEALCLLSEHARPRPGWLEGLLDAAASAPNVGVVGPALGGGGAPGGAYETALFLRDECLLVPRAVFLRLGAFDDRLGGPASAVDYCLRSRQAGWQVLRAPGAAVPSSRRSPFDGRAEARELFAKWAGHPLFEEALGR
jgi:GT2 family glycosyltransferase